MSAYSEVHATSVNDQPTLRSLTITDLPVGVVGQKMRIQVKAKNKAGLYAESDVLEVVVAGVPSTPLSAPLEDTTVTSKSTVGMTYSAPDNQGSAILSYEVQIDDGLGGSFISFAGTTSNHLELSAETSSGIVQGRTYRVRYRARNVNGRSGFSPIASILAASPPDAPPAKPLYITSTSTSITLGLTPTVENNGAPVLHHKLFRDDGAITSSFSQVTSYNGQDTSVEVTGLTVGLTYRFYTTAVNSKGESEPSGEAMYTAGSPPAVPLDLVVASSSKSSITLVWTRDSSSSLAITGFALEINDGTSSPSGRVLSDEAITGTWAEVYDGRGRPEITSVTISELSAGKRYRFRYRSFDANGPSSYSSVGSFYA